MSKTSESAPNISSWHILKIILPVSFRATPLFSALDLLTMPLSSTWFVLVAIVMQHFFDTVKNAAEGLADYHDVITIAAVVIIIQVLNQILNLITFLVSQPLKVKIKGALEKQIHAKAVRLKALDFENEDTLNCITKAKQGADSALVFYAGVSSLMCFHVPYTIAICLYLYHLRPLLLLCLPLILVPLLIAQLVKGRVFGHLADETAPLERKLAYYQKTLYHREFFKETRILGLFGFCNRLYTQALTLFNRKRWLADRKTGLIELGLTALTLSGLMVVIVLLFLSLMEGYISAGAFAAVFASMAKIFGDLEYAFSFYLSGLMEHAGPVKNFVRFLNLPEDTGATGAAVQIGTGLSAPLGISLHDVSFRYPNTVKDALSHINLDIQPGETLALVGENGAGKTTLVRLLTGIIPPTDGKVLAGDKDLTDLPPFRRFAKTSGIFQNFRKYKLSLAANVAISDLNTAEPDPDKIHRVMHQADLPLNERCKQGLDTMLAREFGGIDLSGGEWQRVSLARGLYRNCELIVLDEPTSAIDPIEESKLYHKFVDIAADKTAVIVTHRLGSTKIADRIVVLDGGRIDAIGSHEQLLAADGLYATMYHAQAKWYND